jgi:hypothetical protein
MSTIIKINNSNYNLHIINKYNYDLYMNLLLNNFICDTNFISNSYEELSYMSLEEDGYVGFF